MSRDGGPAFPCVEVPEHPGMTLRDFFAAAALAGFIASDADADMTTDDYANSAYKAADAMLAARED